MEKTVKITCSELKKETNKNLLAGVAIGALLSGVMVGMNKKMDHESLKVSLFLVAGLAGLAFIFIPKPEATCE